MITAPRAAIAATLAALALPLHAEVLDNRVYVSPMYSYTFDDSARNSDAGNGVYVGVGKPLNKFWNIEVGGFYSDFDKSNAGQFENKEYGIKVDGLFFYDRNPSFAPYFGIGLGGEHIEVKNTNLEDDVPQVDAGLGFFKYFNIGKQDVAFRADARYRWTFLQDIKDQTGIDDLAEPIVKVGLAFPFGAKPMPPAPPVVPPPPVLPPVVPVAPVVRDTDGDGVLDTADRCPGTPVGTAVDAYGCALPPPPKPVTERRFDDVLFDFDRSELTVNGRAILDEAARVVNDGSYRSLSINVAGHTDGKGSDGYNQALSERRATTVKRYLVSKGVDAARIRTFAFGESKPVASNETDAGRAKNRRAEVRATSGN